MKRIRELGATAAVALLAASLLIQGSAGADALAIDFEPPTYTTGTIHGQDGWVSLGSAGLGCAVYDVGVVSNGGAAYSYPSFATQSLRISNAVETGCSSDQTFSKPLADEAGEVDAVNGGLSGGTRQATFDASWNFASTVPTAEQPGLRVQASPDRGDGARMSLVVMKDTPTGLAIDFSDFRKGATGCGDGTFVTTTIASGLSRSVTHSIRMAMRLVEGTGNDIVQVFVDGALKITGTSWEDFFRDCQPPGSRTVDSIMFRVGCSFPPCAAAPSTMGKGFLIDNPSATSAVTGPFVAPPVINSPGSCVRTTTVNVAGTTEPDGTAGRAIRIYENALVIDTTTASLGGLWSRAHIFSLGTHVIRATASVPGASSAFSAPVTFTVDTAAPAAPSITFPTPGETVGKNVSVIGSSEPGVSVTVLDGGIAVGSGVADGSGAWRATAHFDTGGSHTLTARAADCAGNLSSLSGPVTVIVDADGPTLVLTTPDNDLQLNPGGGSAVSGTATDPSGVASIRVTFRGVAGGTTPGTTGCTGCPGSPAGFTSTGPALPGTYVVEAAATDRFGNVGPTARITIIKL